MFGLRGDHRHVMLKRFSLSNECFAKRDLVSVLS